MTYLYIGVLFSLFLHISHDIQSKYIEDYDGKRFTLLESIFLTLAWPFYLFYFIKGFFE